MKTRDPKRDERISNEIIVDCYDDGEVAYAWHGYMEENLLFPFSAKVTFKKKDGSKHKKQVEVIELDEYNDTTDLRVGVSVEGSDLLHSVRIMNLEEVEADEFTLQAIEDWQYWKQ